MVFYGRGLTFPEELAIKNKSHRPRILPRILIHRSMDLVSCRWVIFATCVDITVLPAGLRRWCTTLLVCQYLRGLFIWWFAIWTHFSWGCSYVFFIMDIHCCHWVCIWLHSFMQYLGGVWIHVSFDIDVSPNVCFTFLSLYSLIYWILTNGIRYCLAPKQEVVSISTVICLLSLVLLLSVQIGHIDFYQLRWCECVLCIIQFQEVSS